MTNEDSFIISKLREAARTGTPVSVAYQLANLPGPGLAQSSFVMYFKRAFPEIPLRTLLEAAGWSRLRNTPTTEGLNDEEFGRMLSQWIPTP